MRPQAGVDGASSGCALSEVVMEDFPFHLFEHDGTGGAGGLVDGLGAGALPPWGDRDLAALVSGGVTGTAVGSGIQAIGSGGGGLFGVADVGGGGGAETSTDGCLGLNLCSSHTISPEGPCAPFRMKILIMYWT